MGFRSGYAMMLESLATLFSIPPFVACVAISGAWFLACAIARVNPFNPDID